MKPKISVVVPACNAEQTIGDTLESLRSQTFRDFESVVVDDCSSDRTVSIAKRYTKNVIMNKRNMGPAYTRNIGIKRSRAGIIAFIDADAVAARDWLENIYKQVHDAGNPVIMGKVTIPPSGYIGDSISGLGFPAGGSVGFANIWKVSANGLTNHITSCNFAAKKAVFKEHGGFDESFPLAGGEDTEFSMRLERAGVKVKYAPGARVSHAPRKSITSFMRWQLKRGRTNYHFRKRVGRVDYFLRLRLWSTKNIIRHFLFDRKIPMILFLLVLSCTLQQIGYLLESRKRSKEGF